MATDLNSRSATGEAEKHISAMRLASLDAYRGLAMLLMISSGLGIAEVARHYPESRVWQFAARQVEHVRWHGCSLWDLIMPAFLFIVGVAVPFSIASRRRRGQSRGRIFAHALWRSIVLVLLGTLVVTDASPRTDVNFINVLAQIGLGYWLVVLLADRSWRVQAAALVLILVGYGLWFYSYPVPGARFDFASAGVPPNWHRMEGRAAHWEINTNPAAAFDRWFLNLFPRSRPFQFRAGGGTTLNFIPSIATMLLGALAGVWLQSPRTATQKIRGLLVAGGSLLAAGVALDQAILPGVTSMRWTICPIVKRIWTPSFVLYSGGWVLLAFALFYWLIDMRGARRWAFPLVVVGMNSLVAYLLAALATGWMRRTLLAPLGPTLFDGTFGPMLEQICVLAAIWLICLWLYRRRSFIRI